MSELYELEQQLLDLRKQQVELHEVRTLIESPSFQKIVIKGFCEKTAMELMDNLAYHTDSSKAVELLTGISAFKLYLKDMEQQTLAVDKYIAQVEDMISNLINHEDND